MRTIGARERRARLAARHRLSPPSSSVEEVSANLVGFHSSDPSTVFLSARARVEGFAPADLEDALYERRTLVRILGMRRTMFVVPVHLAAVIQRACTDALAPAERRRLVGMLEEQGIARPGQGERWLRRVADETHAALQTRGEATARELTRDVPELGGQLRFGQGTAWAGTMGVSTRVLFLLAAEGRIVRTRPLGSWTSGQYRWAPLETWLGRPLPSIDRHAACAELLTRYLRAFGPVTETDLRWWTGWTARLTRATLSAIDVVEVALEEGRGFVLADDADAAAPGRSWVALLPGLDPTAMGWKERAWYLGEHGRALFDRAGNAGPTIWADGRMVGAWTQAEDGEVLLELLEPVGSGTARRTERERERLRAWLGDVRIRARFRSPLQQALASRRQASR